VNEHALIPWLSAPYVVAAGDVAKLRAAELKHGRVCMLAAVGIITQEVWQWNDQFPSKNFLEAFKTAPALGLAQVRTD
jgi:hypothetical protein